MQPLLQPCLNFDFLSSLDVLSEFPIFDENVVIAVPAKPAPATTPSLMLYTMLIFYTNRLDDWKGNT